MELNGNLWNSMAGDTSEAEAAEGSLRTYKEMACLFADGIKSFGCFGMLLVCCGVLSLD